MFIENLSLEKLWFIYNELWNDFITCHILNFKQVTEIYFLDFSVTLYVHLYNETVSSIILIMI